MTFYTSNIFIICNLQPVLLKQAHEDGISSCGVSCIVFSPTFHTSSERGSKHMLFVNWQSSALGHITPKTYSTIILIYTFVYYRHYMQHFACVIFTNLLKVCIYLDFNTLSTNLLPF